MESNRLDSAFTLPLPTIPDTPESLGTRAPPPIPVSPACPDAIMEPTTKRSRGSGPHAATRPRQHHHMTKKTRNNISTTSETLEILGNNTPLPGRPRNFMIAVVVAIPNISIHPLSPATPRNLRHVSDTSSAQTPPPCPCACVSRMPRAIRLQHVRSPGSERVVSIWRMKKAGVPRTRRGAPSPHM